MALLAAQPASLTRFHAGDVVRSFLHALVSRAADPQPLGEVAALGGGAARGSAQKMLDGARLPAAGLRCAKTNRRSPVSLY